MTECRDPEYLEKLDRSGAHAADHARLILETTAPFRRKPAQELTVLDIGCGYAYAARELARQCRRVVGIEPSPAYAAGARETARGVANLEIRHDVLRDDAVEAGAYDLIILDNVFEHLPDQRSALDIIARGLSAGGALFMLVPYKLWPLEPHYGLPFLSYLPLRLANSYLRLTRRGRDYTDASYAPTYGGLKRMLASRPELRSHFVVPPNIGLADGGASAHYRLGAALIRRFASLWWISKGFLVVAVKEA